MSNAATFLQTVKAKRFISFCLFILCSFCLQSLSAIEKKGLLFGKVLSTEKEVLEFATIHLKGTTYGAVSNESGVYELKAPAGNYTLVVSMLGYDTQEKEIHLTGRERANQHFFLSPHS